MFALASENIPLSKDIGDRFDWVKTGNVLYAASLEAYVRDYKHPLIRQIGFQDANLKRIRDTVGIKDVVICAMSDMCVESAIRSTNDFG